MDFMSKMERKYGKYAIPHLIQPIVFLYAIGFVIMNFAPSLYYSVLCLDISQVLRGQVWRLITFIIYPPSTSFIYILFALYLYFTIGTALENRWGAFRFNVYVFFGMICHIVAAFIVYFATGLTGTAFPITTSYLNMSLFLAFAAMFPDVEFLLFFIIPFKAKWLGILDAVLYGYEIYQNIRYGMLYNPGYYAYALCAILSILNFVIFFIVNRRLTPGGFKQYQRKKQFTRSYQAGEQSRQTNSSRPSAAGTAATGTAAGSRAQQNGQSGNGKTYSGQTFHRCCICGRTENDGDDLEFRYCSKCAGNYEYCMDHIFTHEHRK